MAAHKYRIGQLVYFSPARSAMLTGSRQYKIVRLLPAEDGQNQYRIKGTSETFERMAKEGDLSIK